MLRFIIGVVLGFVAGASAAILTSGKSAQELRLEFERIRSDIEKRDFEALGTHLEERFKELQSGLEERIAQLSQSTADVEGVAEEIVEEVEENAEELQEVAAAKA